MSDRRERRIPSTRLVIVALAALTGGCTDLLGVTELTGVDAAVEASTSSTKKDGGRDATASSASSTSRTGTGTGSGPSSSSSSSSMSDSASSGASTSGSGASSASSSTFTMCSPSNCAGTCTTTGCLVTLASGLSDPTAVAIDSQNVYWIDNGGGGVMKVPIGGGATTTLAPQGQGPNVPSDSIAVDGTSVYWVQPGASGSATSGIVGSVGTAGGDAGAFAALQNTPYAIAVDAQNVYWVDYLPTNAGTVMKQPLTGFRVATALATGVIDPNWIAVDDTNVYYNSSISLLTVPIGGGTPLTFSAKSQPIAIALEGANVYWVTNNQTVLTAPKTGGGMPVTLAGATAVSGPYAIAADAENVYWTNNTGGTVMKVAVTGGAPITLVTGEVGAWGIAIDANSVYFTVNNASGHSGQGTVMKLTPK